jgi:hypothetical protein
LDDDDNNDDDFNEDSLVDVLNELGGRARPSSSSSSKTNKKKTYNLADERQQNLSRGYMVGAIVSYCQLTLACAEEIVDAAVESETMAAAAATTTTTTAAAAAAPTIVTLPNTSPTQSSQILRCVVPPLEDVVLHLTPLTKDDDNNNNNNVQQPLSMDDDTCIERIRRSLTNFLRNYYLKDAPASRNGSDNKGAVGAFRSTSPPPQPPFWRHLIAPPVRSDNESLLFSRVQSRANANIIYWKENWYNTHASLFPWLYIVGTNNKDNGNSGRRARDNKVRTPPPASREVDICLGDLALHTALDLVAALGITADSAMKYYRDKRSKLPPHPTRLEVTQQKLNEILVQHYEPRIFIDGFPYQMTVKRLPAEIVLYMLRRCASIRAILELRSKHSLYQMTQTVATTTTTSAAADKEGTGGDDDVEQVTAAAAVPNDACWPAPSSSWWTDDRVLSNYADKWSRAVTGNNFAAPLLLEHFRVELSYLTAAEQIQLPNLTWDCLERAGDRTCRVLLACDLLNVVPNVPYTKFEILPEYSTDCLTIAELDCPPMHGGSGSEARATSALFFLRSLMERAADAMPLSSDLAKSLLSEDDHRQRAGVFSSGSPSSSSSPSSVYSPTPPPLVPLFLEDALPLHRRWFCQGALVKFTVRVTVRKDRPRLFSTCKIDMERPALDRTTLADSGLADAMKFRTRYESIKKALQELEHHALRVFVSSSTSSSSLPVVDTEKWQRWTKLAESYIQQATDIRERQQQQQWQQQQQHQTKKALSLMDEAQHVVNNMVRFLAAQYEHPATSSSSSTSVKVPMPTGILSLHNKLVSVRQRQLQDVVNKVGLTKTLDNFFGSAKK